MSQEKKTWETPVVEVLSIPENTQNNLGNGEDGGGGEHNAS